MKLDMLDKMIITSIKNGLEKLVPLKFTGEVAMINKYLQSIFLMLILGEILVAVVKRHEAKKKIRLFGMKRND